MSEPGERRVGGYLIVREIGRGGMAAVYLARQIDLDRDVALKELSSFHAADAAFAARFVRESRVAGSMTHPNIVTVYDFLDQDGTPFIAMEYLERGSLRPFVGQTSLAQTIGVLEGALAGLAMAERHDVVHRDIKPENLMVTGDGEIKIADFGIAKALTEVGGPNLTMTGMTVGTPAYMAPEQATAGEVGPWTDLYSLGIVAYEMALGRVPFHDSDTPVAVLMRQVNEDIPSAITVDPSVDRRFSDWIDGLLAKDPVARTRSAREAWYELEEIAVAILGPLWRREARLLVSGTDRAAGPLTPAPFARDTPPATEAGSAYATYLGEGAEKAPPLPPPPPSPEQAQTIAGQAPVAPADTIPAAVSPPPVADTIPGQPPPPTADPSATMAPAAAAAAGAQAASPGSSDTFEWPAGGASRKRGMVIAACILALVVVGGVAFFATRGSSSSSGSGGTSTSSTKTSTKPKPPTAVAQPAQFVPGALQSTAEYKNEAWALAYRDNKVVDLTTPGTAAVPVTGNARNLAGGDGALWLVSSTAGGGQVQRLEPGGAKPVGAPIPFTGTPAALRVVITNGAIWEAVKNGLLRIPEQGGAPARVKNLNFTPFSLEFVGGAIWASDGKSQLATVQVNSLQPAATLVPLTGAGWITGTASSVYAIDSTGVVKINPSNPTSQTPVAGVTAAPYRIAVVGDVLWTLSFPATVGSGLKSVSGTLVGVNLAHSGVISKPITYQAPAGNYRTKLVPIAGDFWLSVLNSAGMAGAQPFKLTG